eukprot:CFRG4908T1
MTTLGPAAQKVMDKYAAHLLQLTKAEKVNGKWRKAIISPRRLNDLRKEAGTRSLMFPLAAQPPKPLPERPDKGHKYDREKVIRLKKVEENMKGMEAKIKEFREKRRDDRIQMKQDSKSYLKTEKLY